MHDEAINRAAAWISKADAILVGAGAGMGVDSGLPDFRGDEGFWRAYPPYARQGLSFVEMANPAHFRRDPAFAWGFYGHRRGMYRRTVPHEGFMRLRDMASQVGASIFVFTSNVDGQFQRAGFPESNIVECHGAIEYEQCVERCGEEIWRANSHTEVSIDVESMRAEGELPVCPRCGGLARPNILMFGDAEWDSTRSSQQWDRMSTWLQGVDLEHLVVIELGAGTAVPSVRDMSERLHHAGACMIRINPREPEIPSSAGRAVGLPLGADHALRRIDKRLRAADVD